MPENTTYVGRGTKWGNPFKLVGDIIYINAKYRRWNLDPWVFYDLGTIEDVILLYQNLIEHTLIHHNNRDVIHWLNHFLNLDISELKGKNLSCFCSLLKPCHADVLLKKLNQ
jgi:hypothetical protein